MAKPAIKVEGLWKQYVIGAQQKAHGTFYDMLSSSLAAPFRALRKRTVEEQECESFWALRDVNFEVQPGEVVGIIGRNGAGKSTLLKILSRITAPTRGHVEVRGRLASLLEVGTGFHPELSGRENIYLNGSILGMSRRDISRRFDEIVAFAEVDKFIDTPVKRYSSGMYVRLAFAVAAHLEPDVLIVDEVLAVGDAEFQRKCLGKMGDVARAGRAVVLVSHNLGAVRDLCSVVAVLDKGELQFSGPAVQGIDFYHQVDRKQVCGAIALTGFAGPLSHDLEFREFRCMQNGVSLAVLDPACEVEIELVGAARRNMVRVDIDFKLYRDGVHVASCYDASPAQPLREGTFISRFRIPGMNLRPGRYAVGVGAIAAIGEWTWAADVGFLDFAENWNGQPPERCRGVVALPYSAERIQNGEVADHYLSSTEMGSNFRPREVAQ